MYYRATKRVTLLGTVGTREEEMEKMEKYNAEVLAAAGAAEKQMFMQKSGRYHRMDLGSYPSNTLYLDIQAVTNGIVPLTLHGTTPDTVFEILSRETLTNTGWNSEGTIIGAEGQDWTPATVQVGTRTNSLFLWARSWQDTDGDGLPDWYEMEVTHTDPNNPDTDNTGVSDGYKDPDNDGWNNLQEYQNRT